MIRPVDNGALERAWARHDQLTKPPRSLGRLERCGVRLAAIQQTDRPVVGAGQVLVCAADHGVTVEGVSAYPAAVTTQMVHNLMAGGAAVNQIAASVGVGVTVLDAGVAQPVEGHRGLLDVAVRRGSGNLAREPAMRSDEADALIEAGRRAAFAAVEQGATVIAVGDMGIGNTTCAAALTSALLDLPPERTTGHGTGIDEATRAHKTAVVATALARAEATHGDLRAVDPRVVLAELGGLEIAAMVGVVLGAAERGVPVVTDGYPVTSGTLVACRLEPAAAAYVFAGHRSVEPGHRAQLDALQSEPLLDLDLRLGEGTGAVLAIPLLRAAARVLAGMATFAEAGVADS